MIIGAMFGNSRSGLVLVVGGSPELILEKKQIRRLTILSRK